MEFNERVRSLREDHDLTQQQLAKILNTTQRKISRMETGEAEPSLKDIYLYCSFFNISADYILGYTNKIKPMPKE